VIKLNFNGPLVYQERNICHNFRGVKAFKRIKITHLFFFFKYPWISRSSFRKQRELCIFNKTAGPNSPNTYTFNYYIIERQWVMIY